ncbi:MAG TPA: hypothetical protein VGM90_19505 [Kofleriaceae bacterium]|jgi:hypothetical protein
MRCCGAASVAVIGLLAATASAQPSDPYGAPASATVDEQVAVSLVARAQELLDQQMYYEARQLALEALQTRSDGAAGAAARVIVRAASKQLAIPDAQLPGETTVPKPVEPPPVLPPAPVPPPPTETEPHSTRDYEERLHGALFLGTIGAMIGAEAAPDASSGAGAASIAGVGAGVIGAIAAPYVFDKIGWDEAQMRTVGSTSVWGGVIGAFMADAVDTKSTRGRDILLGAAIGEGVGALAGAGIASQQRFTVGDVALTDTLAGIGTVGGLTIGMLMQPAQGEAYSVNALLGAGIGYAVGYVAGPLSNTTPRRVARIAGGAAIGGAAPFLLYALIRDNSSTADERVTGLLSSGGLVAGAYIALRLTHGMDEGLDKLPSERADAPVALVGRSSDGHWAMGALSVQPLSRTLSTQPGYAVPLFSGAF